MKNFIKGALSLWTVLTTIWAVVSIMLIEGVIEGAAELKTERRSRQPVSYRSYSDYRRR